MGEVVLTVVIILLVFGVGRLPQVGEAVGKMRRNYGLALKGEDAIDITPQRDSDSASSGPSSSETVDDAELVD